MIKYIVIVMLSFSMIIGCSSAKQANRLRPRVITQDEKPKYMNSQWLKDSNIIMQYALGDTIDITKKALFTSGHIWLLNGIDGEGVKFIKEEHSRDKIDDKMVDIQHFIFVSSQIGDNTIYFEYKKPYSNDVGLKDTLYITIIE